MLNCEEKIQNRCKKMNNNNYYLLEKIIINYNFWMKIWNKTELNIANRLFISKKKEVVISNLKIHFVLWLVSWLVN
jgi:hypothetical protein